jgi:hypothetical protein
VINYLRKRVDREVCLRISSIVAKDWGLELEFSCGGKTAIVGVCGFAVGEVRRSDRAAGAGRFLLSGRWG